MKNIIILFLMLIIVSINCSSQDQTQQEKKYLSDFNGYEWINLKQEEKVQIMIGFLMAHGGAASYFNYLGDIEKNPNIKSEFFLIRDFMLINMTANQISKLLDEFYLKKENMEIPIWAVIYGLSGKFNPPEEQPKEKRQLFEEAPDLDIIKDNNYYLFFPFMLV